MEDTFLEIQRKSGSNPLTDFVQRKKMTLVDPRLGTREGRRSSFNVRLTNIVVYDYTSDYAMTSGVRRF